MTNFYHQQVPGSILATNQGGRWSAIAVDTIAGPSLKTVLYIGTTSGKIIRTLPPTKLQPRGVILEERDVFAESRYGLVVRLTCSKFNLFAK